MQTQVDPVGAAARRLAASVAHGIGQHARHMPRGQPGIHLRREPGRMARLQCQRAGMALAKSVEETGSGMRGEGEAGRKLNQQASEALAQSRCLTEEFVEQCLGVCQLVHVRDRLWDFDAEPEVRRHRCRPALVGRPAVRPVERGIDFRSVEAARVALQVTAFRCEGWLDIARQAPAGATDIAQSLRHFSSMNASSALSAALLWRRWV